MTLAAAAVVGGILAGFAKAAQPGAARPVAAPMRDLQWGQLNFLHTTDTHGWHGGHLQETQYSADWGDYISFAHHMRRRADDEGRDLLLVDTGDRVEGNGLYDSSDPKGKYYYDIYKQQDIDIICTGNHELYQASTAEAERLRTVPNFRDQYIASNLDYIDPESGQRIPMAQRYKKFQTKNQKINIVAFGFLFDFTGNANNTYVQPVGETIREEWFQQAIQEETDLFVVIGHVGIQMQEFKDIFTAIRKQNWLTPIAFFGGHAHVRDATRYDARAFALASGRYFETIGWMSIDGLSKTEEEISTTAVSFQRRYIDNNLLGLYYHSGLNESAFATDHGKKVSQMIVTARKALDLDYTFGCAPRDLWMSRAPYPGDDSIYTWLETEVLPEVVVNPERSDKARLAILNTGTIRFDIFKGAFTRDTTYIVSPFLSTLHYIPDVPYVVAKKVIKLLNNAGHILDAPGFPDSRFMGIPEQFVIRESIIYEQPSEHSFEMKDFGGQQVLGGQQSKKPDLVGGYTTKDDISSDGDDAVHSPLNFYTVPNCIQAEIGFSTDSEPETVDLVFLDFILPWILLALKFSGGSYSKADASPYLDETFTEHMASWIKKNWPDKC
jgi:2',3'-cyclic-nucleotide 2'-phosphodiesterase (5'-nucleotidase family)